MTERWPDLAGRIEGKMHVLPIRVYYEDTDFSGAVYHANYLKFCERARSDCLRLMGIHHSELHGTASFVVRRMVCDFLKPALIDDLLEVETRFVEFGGARMELGQSVKRDRREAVRGAGDGGAGGRARQAETAAAGMGQNVSFPCGIKQVTET